MPEEREKLQQVVSVAKQRVGDRLSDIWQWFMIRGVLALVLAIVALFWPQKTISLLVNLLGVYFLFDSVVGAFGAIRTRGQAGFPVSAIVSLVVGAILLFWTRLSVTIFLTLIGVWALLQGVGLWLSNRNKGTSNESHHLFGIVGGVLAVTGLIVIVWPTTGVVAVSWLIASVSLVAGGLLTFVATRLRRISHHISGDRIVNGSEF